MSAVSRVDDLQTMRSRLLAEIENAEGSALAPLVRELRMVLAELDDLEQGEEVSVVDQLARKREARRADAKGGELPARSHKRG